MTTEVAPAVATDAAPTEGTEIQAPTTTEPTITTSESAPATPATPEAPAQPAQPDISSLLSDEEFVRNLLKDERIRKEINHRASSEAGRLAAEKERQIRMAAEQQQEAARLKSMDEFELGQHMKQQWQQQEAEAAIAQRVYGDVYNQLFAALDTNVIKATPDFTEDDHAALNPARFNNIVEWNNAVINARVAKAAASLKADFDKRVHAEALKEAEALVQERLKDNRDNAPSAPILPVGEVAQTDADFLRDYSRGKNNDHARAKKLLGM